MSYTPTQWQTGDTITAEKLNNMESGIENANEPFIVTCTPTAQDYSGVMDKTVAEINEAYAAGRKIAFRIDTGRTYFDAQPSLFYKAEEYTYGSFQGYFIMNNSMIQVYTPHTSDGTIQTYGAISYSLTQIN